ncbi:MAG: aspartyl protease [Phormidesmis sp.]
MSDIATSSTAKDEIVLTLILINSTDAILGEHGFISLEEVRSCVVDDVVSTSTTHFCLPADVIQQLGLKRVGRMSGRTVKGIQTFNVYEGVRFDVDGGIDGIYRCIELPIGQRPLLGRVPLEDLGLEPDPEAQCLQRVPIRV